MQYKFIKLIGLLICIQLLGACASSGAPDFFRSMPDKDYSNMYLRGVFNWWEINESFKLIASSENEFSVTIELIADGQPYDFKVADSTWTMALNCGNSFKGNPMVLNSAVDLFCDGDSLNLQFTPVETALYRFVLDASNNDRPSLSIVKIN